MSGGLFCCLLVLCILGGVRSQSLISSTLSSTVTYLAVSSNGVFVSTANQVHRFSSTLQQLEGSPDTPGGTIDGIASTPDGEWCVVCTDDGGVTCSVLNGSNLQAPANRTVDLNSGTATSLVVFTVDGNSFYTGSFVNPRILYHQYWFAGSTLSRATNPANQIASFTRVFVSGFFASGYAYYVVIDPPPSGNQNRLRIIRVCNDSAVDSATDSFNNQYELTLGCDGNNAFFNPTLRGVSVINEETLLIAISADSNDICSYSLSQINSLMDTAYQSCVINGTGNKNIVWQSSASCSGGLTGSICSISDSRGANPAPAVGVSNPLTSTGLVTNNTILTGLTAIVGVSIDDNDFIYFAFSVNSNNYINKYHLVNSTTLTFVSEVTLTSSITVLKWTQGSEYVYGISGSNVIALKIEDCSSATSCSECVSLGDPLCGWCMIENKCSRRPFCQDSYQERRYLTQGDSNNCFDTVSINPSTYVIDTEQEPHQVNLTFSPAPPPPTITEEEYFCVFNGIMSPLELSMGTNTGSCSVEGIVSQVTGIQLDTTFSIYSNRTNVNFYTRPSNYTFYNCPTATECSACLQSETCGWCQLDFTCTGQNSSCTTGEWFNIKDGGDARSFCPFLEPNSVTSDGRYTQAANVVKNLTLSTSNTGSPPGLTYECVYGTIANRTATVSSDNRVTCINNPGLMIGGSTQNVLLSLTQVFNGNRYTIETNAPTNLNVTLYDCPSLALGCSSCLAQRIGTGFNCSWCTSNNQCRDISDCSDSPVISTGSCPQPNITDFNPKTGPPSGRITIIINGTNLGTQRSDIESVMIGSRNCVVGEYEAGKKIMCTIDPDASDNMDRNETIMIRVTRSSGSVTVNSMDIAQFQFLTPVIRSVSPTFGPFSGGTRIRIQGTNFDIGNKEMTKVMLRESSSRKKRNTCPDVNCDITRLTNTEINCLTGSINGSECTRNIIVSVNQALFSNTSISYEYRPDPTFNSISPVITIPAGGIKLVFSGDNLNSVQSPTITINHSGLGSSSTEPCVFNVNGTTLTCNAPNITNVANSDYGMNIEYILMLDGAESPDYNDAALRLTLQRNPMFTGIDPESRSISVDDINDITIKGMNVESVRPSEINITLRDNSDVHVCTVRTSSNTEITCRPPNKESGTTLSVTVRVGRNLVFPPNGTSGPEWTLTYTRASDPGNVPLIAGASAGAVLVLVAIVLLILIIPLVYCLRRQAKQQDMRVTHLLSQMESMELDMADQCKQAFAELQTDLGELVAEDSLDMQQLPFHDFPTYATKVFFPAANTNHPVLSPPKVPHGMTHDSMCVLLDEFRELVFDKKFLVAFIRTLESRPKFNLQDKSTMASLLMVACLKDISYSTEVLEALLGNLIRRSLSNTKNHPKLLLRRTESVAEKLLTNWFCVTLYPYMLECAGAPLFVLFKAVKAQLEKGPIDVITGDARNSLSEEKLLRQPLDFKVMECEVEMGNSHTLLRHTRKEDAGVEPDPSNADDIQTIKVMDTDSVSQTKEKLLDFIYGNRPVSKRPSIAEVELELCRGNAGIPLKDQDTTSRREGEWMRINTLGHFNILEMAEAAIADPKKPIPRFRLTARNQTLSPGRPVSGAVGYDVPGTIVASASITSQTSLLASVNSPSFDTNTRLFHLVKPEANEGDQKIVSEVFLTRLLSTKRIIQSYVDDLFHAIFSVPAGKSLPRAIKIVFDFLDAQAAENGITDPEILHTWKTNTLPLRFWVNLIKNPDFVFDINKSATIDACFTVIAQAYIDACSTAEVRYTKDTPSARLLYANEVKQYKEEVLQYYRDIMAQPQPTAEDNKSYFQEMAENYFQSFESKEGLHFHSDSALLEIYRYAIQYGDDIMETLTEERLTLMGAQFNSLRQKYNVNSSAM
ncbi:PREDICTED: plexin-A1-like [Amphimedon queenslandica]|uniref:Sema domain-containing protein n=1 Tax=Amphimedon queenslandica TaxID=400682 RepID=A0A1X7VVB4_AMPQE|nr:PREDICTED: plexin-A1-like [Amphimedon queenslandica]|eukprot:XP_019851565.1 PREDICTED: plexin-A1-like [Amphimedon queenslandica]